VLPLPQAPALILENSKDPETYRVSVDDLAALGRADRRRRLAIARQNGKLRPKGKCEGNFWRRFDPFNHGRILSAARGLDKTTRKDGRHNGAVGHIGLEVLEALLGLVDYASGRLEPSIEWICHKINRSRAAVVAALARLRVAGLVDWIRRYIRVDDQGREQIKQTTNAYRIRLPEPLVQFVRVKKSAPPPVDEAEREKARHKMVADLHKMAAQMYADEVTAPRK
jgi:hypothetical protein